MNRLHRTLVPIFAFTLLAGAAPTAAQEVALTRGSDGDLRATWDGEEPTEFVLMTATVDREGNVLEQSRGKTFVLKPGQDINVGRVGVAGGGVAYDQLRPINDPMAYTPERDGLPGKRYWTNPAADVLTPRKDDVAAGPSGTGKTMDADNDERAMPRVKTNTVRKRPGRTKAAEGEKTVVDKDPPMGPEVGGRETPDDDFFHIVTLVPADESAQRIHVQPVILHGTKSSDRPD